jgi:hypothetical protein
LVIVGEYVLSIFEVDVQESLMLKGQSTQYAKLRGSLFFQKTLNQRVGASAGKNFLIFRSEYFEFLEILPEWR